MSRRLIQLLAVCLVWGAAHASASYVYDFPGAPGSGLAANQTNPQPGNATFGDFTHVGVTGSPTADVFESYNWSLISGSTPDPTTYDTFSITASAGYHLNLTGLTFDQMRGPGGPTKGQVALFLNGSTTPYATMDYNPASQLQGMTFNFTPTTDAMDVTSAEFRFYCWNAGGTTSTYTMLFDNVTTNLAIVPEASTWLSALIPLSLIVASSLKWRRSRHTASAAE